MSSAVLWGKTKIKSLWPGQVWAPTARDHLGPGCVAGCGWEGSRTILGDQEDLTLIPCDPEACFCKAFWTPPRPLGPPRGGWESRRPGSPAWLRCCCFLSRLSRRQLWS